MHFLCGKELSYYQFKMLEKWKLKSMASIKMCLIKFRVSVTFKIWTDPNTLQHWISNRSNHSYKKKLATIRRWHRRLLHFYRPCFQWILKTLHSCGCCLLCNTIVRSISTKVISQIIWMKSNSVLPNVFLFTSTNDS